MPLRETCCSVCDFILEYDTPRIVLIKNKKVGLINRLVQLVILSYIIGWVLIWRKGYQDFDSIVSSVIIKVKGVAFVNSSGFGERLWDSADYIIPPEQESSFFVMTNLIRTENQTQGHCPEVSLHKCIIEVSLYKYTNACGVLTGKCVTFNEGVKTCEVLAWCPLESQTVFPNPALLGGAENFTVLIKNNIRFPQFNFSKRNILPNISASYLKTCVFNRTKEPYCPIFRLGDIVRETGDKFQELALQGGVIGILIKWNCNLDRSASECVPQYTFQRLDNRNVDETVSPGYNFRYAKYYENSAGKETRTLIKAYGIRFEVEVFGKAGKFNIIPTMISIGSGIALLGMGTVLCDMIILHLLKKRNYYKEKKYKYVEDYERVSP
uniref:P2X purinoceptor n=1 Tax=Callorhinchus milii TaxID=7868 RepID=A0A4W3HD60_CALMI